MLPVGGRNKVGGWEVEGFLKAVILHYRIEQKEKFKHNFRHDAMGDSQNDNNDQVFAHNLCETYSS